MQIRCSCGNEMRMSAVKPKTYSLLDMDWYNAEAGQIHCPKCKNSQLPVEVAGTDEEEVYLRIVMDDPQIRKK